MMLRPIDNFFLKQEEPYKSVFEFLRQYILQKDPDITEAWKYGLPMYEYKGKMFCYLWSHKKFLQPYIGIVRGAEIDHPELLQEKRAKMKILLINPEKDIPVKKLDLIFKKMLALYK